MNNKSYAKNIYYNISMINIIENRKIKSFKTEITKIIINLIKNNIEYHMEELYDYEEFDKMIRLLTNIKAFL